MEIIHTWATHPDGTLHLRSHCPALVVTVDIREETKSQYKNEATMRAEVEARTHEAILIAMYPPKHDALEPVLGAMADLLMQAAKSRVVDQSFTMRVANRLMNEIRQIAYQQPDVKVIHNPDVVPTREVK